MSGRAEVPIPLSGPVTISEFGARLAEMTDRVLAGEEIVVWRGTQPVARFVPVEPRAPKRLGVVKEFLSEEERHVLAEVMDVPLPDADRRNVTGEETDDLGS